MDGMTYDLAYFGKVIDSGITAAPSLVSPFVQLFHHHYLINFMESNTVKQIHEFGQSIWLDFIDRQIMNSGNLKKLIDDDGIRGVTSNPAIFEKAISSSSDYDQDIAELAEKDITNEELFFKLAVKDIRQAADLFGPLYNEGVVGADGYVSLEVSPLLALDEEKTTQQALALWRQVDRKNVMIKIPGTKACLPAITKAIREGINVNVTLLFGLERYEEVANAYIAGLEERQQAGEEISQVASVASFFLSRVDILVDPLLEGKGLPHLKGKVAIASAKKAYEIYKRIFSSERWKALEAQGAKPQRLLWASTGVKDPAYRDTMYLEELIGPNTVNTAPLDTITAFRDHGVVAANLESDLHGANDILKQLGENGIDMATTVQQLEDEGIEKFNVPYKKLLAAIDEQRKKSA
jgi:transaldolase